jgi:AcrR family transcriptional regulator
MGEFEDRRAALAAAVADHLLVEGLGDSGLRALARAAGTSDRMLLYYFRDKAEVLGAALDLVAERALAALDAAGPCGRASEAELLGRLAATLHDPRWGAPNRLWIEVSARATRGEEPWRSAAGRLLGGCRTGSPPGSRKGRRPVRLGSSRWSRGQRCWRRRGGRTSRGRRWIRGEVGVARDEPREAAGLDPFAFERGLATRTRASPGVRWALRIAWRRSRVAGQLSVERGAAWAASRGARARSASGVRGGLGEAEALGRQAASGRAVGGQRVGGAQEAEGV